MMENLPETRQGMTYGMTAFFLVAQMAGAGFLALPHAFGETGWIGLPLLILFCFSVGFSGTRLGHCWVILEERWPEYRKPVRQPYMEIAYRAYGSIGRKTILVSVLLTVVGLSILYIILIAQFLHSLVQDISTCIFITIVTIVFIPVTWLGTPKDFWQSSVLAVAATVVACTVVFVQMLIDKGTWYEPDEPFYRNPTFTSFSVGFSTILFSFGGGSVFPTIQNDMSDRSQFWKSITIGYAAILTLYLPMAITGYTLFGYGVPSNILLYRGNNLTIAIKVAIGFEIINLLASFPIAFNPSCQIMEEMLNIPPKFGIQRVLFRTALIGFDLMIALAIPDFALIMNLVGGSTAAICSFLAPPAMYIKLIDDKSNPNWPKRSIPLWQKILLYELVIVAFIGIICATGSAIYEIIQADFSISCFADYTRT